jgi:SP family arabinose:H+ symporter-like MFS transporter
MSNLNPIEMLSKRYIIMMIALIVALGGLLMGFDASVISGVVKFIEPEFNLTKLELGWAVASLTLTSTFAMMTAGPLSDRIGRRTVLRYAAILYAVSAVGSALATNFMFLVISRMIGGFGVGASLILAPMYIAEMAPPSLRGRMVSFNQLNIVIGISLAFFTNYLILTLGDSGAEWTKALKLGEHNWRWMLGIEALPAVLYYLGLFFVPQSPRWLILNGRFNDAMAVMTRLSSKEEAEEAFQQIVESSEENEEKSSTFKDLLRPELKLVLMIGIVVAILQQITGINSVFFYAPMIFEQSGIGTDASFVQAILVGIVNLVFTIVAILFIDKLGRKPLLGFGVAGIALCMFLLAYEFHSATYEYNENTISMVSSDSNLENAPELGMVYTNEKAFLEAVESIVGAESLELHKSEIVSSSIHMDATMILIAILGFVASFAISIGPVMWVLFSELFPNNIRGVAVSFVGLINSAVSFLVQWIFPWELEVLGNTATFMIYGVFAAIGLIFILRVIPETKGKSLEELEQQLVHKN